MEENVINLDKEEIYDNLKAIIGIICYIWVGFVLSNIIGTWIAPVMTIIALCFVIHYIIYYGIVFSNKKGDIE